MGRQSSEFFLLGKEFLKLFGHFTLLDGIEQVTHSLPGSYEYVP